MHVKRDGRVVVEFIVGGSGHAYVPASTADVCVVVDSQDELARIPDLDHVLKIPLGDHETVLTLLDRARAVDPGAAALFDEYRLERNNVYLASGMAQDARLGACAVRDAAHRGLLDQFFREIVVRIFEAANGHLSLVVVREVNSQAGGMGSAGAPEIGARFRQHIAQHTSAQIAHHMIRIGGETYLRVAERATANTGFATRRDLDSLLGSSAPRVTRDLEFLELPLRSEDGLALRDKRTQRDALAGTVLAALCGDALRTALDAREVNCKPVSTLGETRTIRASWSAGLDVHQLTRAAAIEYRRQLGDLRSQCSTPNLSVIHGIRVDLAMSGATPSLDEATSAIRRGAVRDPIFDTIADAPIPQYRVDVFVETFQDSFVAVDHVLNGLAKPNGPDDVRASLQQFHGVIAHLDRSHTEAADALRTADATLEKRRGMLKKVLRRLQSPLRTFEMAISPKALLRRSTAVFRGFIDALAQMGYARARATALQGALERVRADCAAYEDAWIGSVDRMLDQFVDRASLLSDAIAIQSLDGVYTELIAAARHDDRGDRQYLEALLLRSIRRITFNGLAALLGTEPTPEGIITGLEQERFAWIAPMWGGGSGRAGSIAPRERFVVLPPVGPGDLQVLRRLADQRGFAPELVVADSVAAGCCIVALDVYPVLDRADLETPLYSPASATVAETQRVM